MNQRRFVLGSLGALLLSCTMGSAHANVEPVEGYLEQWQRDNRLPGVAAAVIEGTTSPCIPSVRMVGVNR